METILTKVTSNGQVVIPKKLRIKYGIRSAAAIRWIQKDHGILMVPESENPILAARGMLEGSGVLKAYLRCHIHTRLLDFLVKFCTHQNFSFLEQCVNRIGDFHEFAVFFNNRACLDDLFQLM